VTYLDRITQFVYPPAHGDESEELRLNRAILVVMASATSMGGVVWGTVYLALGVPEVAIWPYSYVALSFINLLVYIRTRHYETLLIGQLSLILLIPTFLQWHLGGFALSGSVSLWAFVSPIVALIVSKEYKSARIWFFAFFGLVFISGVLEGHLPGLEVGMPHFGIVMFFVMNIFAPLITAYFIVYYFIQEGRRATRTMVKQSAELAQSNQSLQELSENLEEKVIERTQQLSEALDAAESANRAKSLFLANMSHELRTPLNAIIGYSEILEEDAVDFGYEDAIPDLHKIKNAGKHLLSLINDILDISKIEAGEIDIYLEEFELIVLLDEVLSTIEPLIQQNNNTVVFEGDKTSLGQVTTDSTKLRQVIFNLVSNATKFTENGTITVSGQRYLNHEDEDWIEIAVSDTGIGMTEQQAEKVFQEFTQADESTTRNYGGTGLGLPISRHFCEVLGGDIVVNSISGEGSTFTVHLPAIATAPAPKVLVEASDNTPDEPSTLAQLPTDSDTVILVIDDDKTVHDVLSHQLSRKGFHVVTVNSGQAGLDMARKLKPALITLDIMMPSMDGWSVLAQLKADPELGSIPVIMLSILKNKSLGLSLGASDYLTKPVDRDVLVATIKRFLPADLTKSCNVLIIEDEPDIQELFQRTVERAGWNAEIAENGRVGLDKLNQQTPDIILLDLMMPEMDGLEFLSTMRQNPEWQTLPVIAITAKTLTESDKKQLGEQAQRVLEKGDYSKDDLVQQIRDLLKAYQSEEASY
jgi:signal transduction histidine kinase/DNA-binding response OmpR family regulator